MGQYNSLALNKPWMDIINALIYYNPFKIWGKNILWACKRGKTSASKFLVFLVLSLCYSIWHLHWKIVQMLLHTELHPSSPVSSGPIPSGLVWSNIVWDSDLVQLCPVWSRLISSGPIQWPDTNHIVCLDDQDKNEPITLLDINTQVDLVFNS